jgi:hypothetical protein
MISLFNSALKISQLNFISCLIVLGAIVSPRRRKEDKGNPLDAIKRLKGSNRSLSDQLQGSFTDKRTLRLENRQVKSSLEEKDKVIGRQNRKIKSLSLRIHELERERKNRKRKR